MPLVCVRMRTLLLIALLAVPAAAQTPGACTLGTAQGDLATPDLLARVFNTGSLFFGGTTTNGDGYLVPRAAATSPLYAAGLWVAGRVGGEVRAAGSRYASFSFWPGPLDDSAALPNASDCSAFDRIYVVSPADVAAYEATGVASPDLAAWPVGLGARAVDAGGQPVVASSRGQVVDLAAGERPVLYGGPTAFWVMNDVGGPHTVLNTPPLGIEVRVTAFAVDASAGERPVALRQSTVVRFEIVNRNSVPLEDLHPGFFMDPDLGNAIDDQVGADTTRGMAFVYNADNLDDGLTGSGGAYGSAPPAFGLDALGGLWSHSVMESGISPTLDPITGAELYNRLLGLWNDGSVIRAYSYGYAQSQGDTTRYAYTGDPVTSAFWSERNTDGSGTANNAGDRRHMLSAPAVTLAPGASTTFDLALLFAREADHLGSITALRALSDGVQDLYDDGHLFGAPPPAASLAAPALVSPADGAVTGDADVTLAWEPVPGADHYVVEVSRTADFEAAEPTIVAGTTFVFPAGRLPLNRTGSLYWRVRGAVDGREGAVSTARAFRGSRYEAGPMRLASGALAFVETTAPGGGSACDGPGDPDEGCTEVGGDLVERSLNSTGDYLLLAGAPATAEALASIGPREVEIRFTDTGSIAYSGALPSSRRLFRIPFEVWDIGVETPGTVNDPSDDRQLVVQMEGPLPATAALCAFEYVNPTEEGLGLTTRAVGARHPVGDDYAAFAADAEAAVAGAPDGCPVGTAAAAAYARVDVGRPRPLASVRFEQAGTRTTADLAGATIRFYTADPIVDGEAAPTEAALALAPPRPNPAAGRVALPYRVAAAGHVRLTVVDALGRTVATLADGVRSAGEHTASLDARRLAPGVYAVVLDAGGRRAVRRLTVAW